MSDDLHPAEAAPAPPEPAGPPRPKKRAIGLAVALAVLCIVGVAAETYVTVKGGVRQAIASLPFMRPDLPSVFGKQKLRVLVLGIDDNWTDNDELYTGNTRSDTNIGVEIDLPTHNVSVVSIPRDLWVDIPKDGFGKLNEAYADAGPERTEETLIRDLGTPPWDYYVVLNINATKSVVDAIGGLDIDVEKDMDYDDEWGHLHIHLKKGLHHLDGDETVGYIRYRHDEEGDYGRMRRQRQVVQVLVKRLRDPSIIAHVPALVGVFRQNVRTDMPYDKMLQLALGLQDVTPQMVHETEIPTNVGWTQGESVLFYDQSQTQAIVHKYLTVGFSGQFDPSTVHVKIENGSGTPGAAAALAQYLQARGFTIVATGNAKTFDNPKTTVTGMDQKLMGEIIKELPIHNPVIATGPVVGGDVDIVVGRDYQAQ